MNTDLTERNTRFLQSSFFNRGGTMNGGLHEYVLSVSLRV